MSCLLLLIFATCHGAAAAPDIARLAWNDPLKALPQIEYRVIQRIPHDPNVFTQGLAFHGKLLVESGGRYRRSRLLVRTLQHKTPLTSIALPASWWAEGLAVHGDQVTLLTWHEGIASTYSLPELKPLGRWRYRGEGWGLASDGDSFIQSDGSDLLKWRSSTDFSITRRLYVTANGEPLGYLNELEWVQGWVLANVWQSDWIVAINPADGHVGWTLSLQGLLNTAELLNADVANGIAWDAATQQLWVTGKLWPWLFALELKIPPVPTQLANTGDAVIFR